MLKSTFIEDLGMRDTEAEDLLDIVMHRQQRSKMLLGSNRPVDDWGKLLGDTGWRQCHA